jgi:hypothetical protein
MMHHPAYLLSVAAVGIALLLLLTRRSLARWRG